MDLNELLDALAARAETSDFSAPPAEWRDAASGIPAWILTSLAEPHLRPEHRQRIHEDILRHRELFSEGADERLVQLAVWSEHVESLHKSMKKGGLETFHYVRALEATSKRCGFNLLPLMDRVDELGHAWGGRDLKKTYTMVSPHFEEPDASGEAT